MRGPHCCLFELRACEEALRGEICAPEPELGPSKRGALRVLIVWPGDRWTLGEIRLGIPLAVWAKEYEGEIRARPFARLEACDVAWAQVVVLQREATFDLLHRMLCWREAGKAVIFDMDDLLTAVPDFLLSSAHYTRSRPLIEAALRRANLVTTTTSRLAAELPRDTASIAVIPNCTAVRNLSRGTGAPTREPVCLIFAASDTVRVEFLAAALRQFQQENPGEAVMLAVGPSGEALRAAGVHLEYFPIMSNPEFHDFVAARGDAIGIIPLDDSRFSSCKSAVKFLDYASHGLPTICSRVPPYSDFVTDEVDGILVDNDAQLWSQQIRRLVKDAALRERLGGAAMALAQRSSTPEIAAQLWNSALQQAVRHAAENPARPEPAHRRLLARIEHLLRLGLDRSVLEHALQILAREGPLGLWERVVRTSR